MWEYNTHTQHIYIFIQELKMFKTFQYQTWRTLFAVIGLAFLWDSQKTQAIFGVLGYLKEVDVKSILLKIACTWKAGPRDLTVITWLCSFSEPGFLIQEDAMLDSKAERQLKVLPNCDMCEPQKMTIMEKKTWVE